MAVVRPSAWTSNGPRAARVGLALSAMGAATSLGGVAGACAAARAGMARPRPIETFLVLDDDELGLEPVTAHPVSFLTEGFGPMARLARLGSLALRDLASSGALAPEDVSETPLVLGIGSGYYLDALAAVEGAEDGKEPFGASLPAVSEATEEGLEELEALLVSRTFALAGLPLPREHTLVADDHAAGAAALLLASEVLARGARRCLVGAVDSYCDPATLEALQGLDLLKSAGSPTGLAPGEAAVFLLVERRGARGARGAIDTVVHDPSGAHLFSGQIHACRRLASALAPLAGGSRLWTIGSHNGTASVASEWGRALSISPRPIADAPHWYPATSFGDTGAASGLLGACIAARAFARRYAAGERALVWSSSPCGSKAAFTVQAG